MTITPVLSALNPPNEQLIAQDSGAYRQEES
jgi:hypothetical protein